LDDFREIILQRFCY